MHTLRLIKFLLPYFLSVNAFSATWYSEYWQHLRCTIWEEGKWRQDFFLRLETGNHWQGFRRYHITQELKYKASDNFTAEVHYTYAHGRGIESGARWHWVHRIELEANPSFSLPLGTLKLRNRLELRRFERNPVIQYTIRQRTMWTVPIDYGHLKSYSIYNEVFYDFNPNRWNQDRLCPMLFTFELGKASLDVFVFFRFFKVNRRHIKTSLVTGTELLF